MVKRFAPREGAGRHEIALQVSLQSGLAGSLDVSGRSSALAPLPVICPVKSADFAPET